MDHTEPERFAPPFIVARMRIFLEAIAKRLWLADAERLTGIDVVEHERWLGQYPEYHRWFLAVRDKVAGEMEQELRARAGVALIQKEVGSESTRELGRALRALRPKAKDRRTSLGGY